MRFVIFGLTVSSAWGNGHATLWRGLIGALDAMGHTVTFYERDVPYYAAHRDLAALPGRAELRLYSDWALVAGDAARASDQADVAMVTSYCFDGRAACELVLGSRAPARVFYDLDTPVTLARLDLGEDVPYLPREGLSGFDLVLSFTGGRALERLRAQLGAGRVAPLFGSVDPDAYRAGPREPAWAGDCSYLGTWSADRQHALDRLLFEPARRRPARRFVLGGSKYPDDLAWPANLTRLEHVPPGAHPRFYASSPLTLNVTRAPMAALGFCPSGRLFEAAACGVPVLSDAWPGLDDFFTPGEEILIAHTADDALAAMDLGPIALARIGARARARVYGQHSARHRALELITLIERGGGP